MFVLVMILEAVIQLILKSLPLVTGLAVIFGMGMFCETRARPFAPIFLVMLPIACIGAFIGERVLRSPTHNDFQALLAYPAIGMLLGGIAGLTLGLGLSVWCFQPMNDRFRRAISRP